MDATGTLISCNWSIDTSTVSELAALLAPSRTAGYSSLTSGRSVKSAGAKHFSGENVTIEGIYAC